MIVTRRRRKPFKYKKLIFPAVLLAMLIAVAVWPPTHAVIFGGRLTPVWSALGTAAHDVAAPFSYARQNEVITERNRRIVALQRQLADLRSQLAAKQQEVTQLQGTVAQLQQQQAAARAKAAPSATASPGALVAGGVAPGAPGGGAATGGGAFGSSVPPEIQRAAQEWSAMDPDKAAAVARRLPIGYVARVLAQMSPDAAAEILDALPAAYAAKVMQENPSLHR